MLVFISVLEFKALSLECYHFLETVFIELNISFCRILIVSRPFVHVLSIITVVTPLFKYGACSHLMFSDLKVNHDTMYSIEV